MSFFLDLARKFASIGWPVFPLKPRDKKPLISKKRGGNGYKDATTDMTQIEAWARMCPNANVGIATGGAGLVVLDVDGPEGLAQLLEVSAGDIPETLCATTGREGGLHRYYLGTDVSSSQRDGEHLDVRGNTGYVVAPGSIHPSGRVYAWVEPMAPPVRRPEWVGPWVRNRGKTSDKKATPSVQLAGVAPRSSSRRLADRATDGMNDPEPFSWEEAARLASALAAIPAKIDGKLWVSYLFALHDLHWIVDGIDVGLEIANKWSSLSDGVGEGNHEYKGRANIEQRFASFNREYNGKRVTVGSIYADAKARGWVFQPVVAQPEIVNGANGVHALPAALLQDSNAIRFPDTDKYGKPKATCANAVIALRRLGVSCAYDQFHDRMHVAGHPVGEWVGDLTDNAVHMLRVVVRQQFHFDPGTGDMFDAVVQEALQHAYDPVQDYLDGLRWDGVPRLDTWMRDYLGAGDDPFTREVARLSLLAAVRRAREPGCKFDQVIVLEGPEGQGKSSAIELLAGSDNYSDQTILGLDDRAQQEQLNGVWLYEIGDLAKMGKADSEQAKAMMSRTVDRARPAYGRARVDRPRRCILFGSTNADTYLQSQTGNRRWWPVRTTRIDLDGLARDRDQLWGEAVFWEERGASLILPPALWSEAAKIQGTRLDQDPWDDALRRIETYHLRNKTFQAPDVTSEEYRISTRDILDLVLRLPVEKQNPVTAKRVAYCLRRLGWEGPKNIRDEQGIAKGWTKMAGSGTLP